ncbi:hypothetical protein M409DRAFT_52450 [Zasmidium cellare ATCC 36951]|uniref:Uncharacterized protein n=1 Tax=Zasmidium cellare ATCC 36951 TaxID=1080233 RepID=A0A6A6CTR3_ZASCE|nr:uncharacterized protein M409DRAFT_52450 [Zasmidium cellare ATCC 36951]KAF2169169.1 hypothetical protein M409DRAFT_52450 [Zasmidium cellare ATCC 36951]
MQNNRVAQDHGTFVPESPVILVDAPRHDEVSITARKKGVTIGHGDLMLRTMAIEKSFFNNGPPLTASPLTAQLGFPLEAVASPMNESIAYNYPVNEMFASSNPESSEFLTDYTAFYGDVSLVRADGKAMSPLQIEALLTYINQTRKKWLTKTRHMKEGEAKEVERKKVKARLTPEAFHTFFENLRRQMLRAGNQAFKNVVSPVSITLSEVAPACGACYAKAEPGKHLLTCAKSKTRYYCGRACQKED